MQCKAAKPQVFAASAPSVYLCTVLPARYRGNPARHPVGVCLAKRRDDDDDDSGSSGLSTVTSTLNSAVDSLAALVPDSVPRNVAKGGVTVVGALVVFGLVKQLISGIFTLVLIGGVGYWWLTKDTKDDDEDDYKSKGKKGKASVDDLGDPLSDAQRIMDKYK